MNKRFNFLCELKHDSVHSKISVDGWAFANRHNGKGFNKDGGSRGTSSFNVVRAESILKSVENI